MLNNVRKDKEIWGIVGLHIIATLIAVTLTNVFAKRAVDKLEKRITQLEESKVVKILPVENREVDPATVEIEPEKVKLSYGQKVRILDGFRKSHLGTVVSVDSYRDESGNSRIQYKVKYKIYDPDSDHGWFNYEELEVIK